VNGNPMLNKKIIFFRFFIHTPFTAHLSELRSSWCLPFNTPWPSRVTQIVFFLNFSCLFQQKQYICGVKQEQMKIFLFFFGYLGYLLNF